MEEHCEGAFIPGSVDVVGLQYVQGGFRIILFQQISAVMQGIKATDYAEEYEELKTALIKIGYW